MKPRDGNAIVYCEGAFGTPYGKTAHGLARFTQRYQVLSVIDSRLAGRDAGDVLDGVPCGLPVLASVAQAVTTAQKAGSPPTHLVVGLAPDGGRLSDEARADICDALRSGLHVDSGLHDFLSDDPGMADLARTHSVTLRDIRRPPPRPDLHFFTGKIEQVTSFKVAVLGTDSAVGKRTTAWRLVHGLQQVGIRTEMVGTGQTAWMQGARYGTILDTLVNDFVAGEIEHAVWSAWKHEQPRVLVLEGQGSLMNPAYPGGFELLAAGRPDVVVLQHAPARRDYDGFPGYPIQPLPRQIQAIELISGRPVVAITINHEALHPDQAREACADIHGDTGLPAMDVLLDGTEPLIRALTPHLDPADRKVIMSTQT